MVSFGHDGLEIMPECVICGRRKSPRGRDVGVYAAVSYCDWECEGYDLPPLPSEYFSVDDPPFSGPAPDRQ